MSGMSDDIHQSMCNGYFGQAVNQMRGTCHSPAVNQMRELLPTNTFFLFYFEILL